MVIRSVAALHHPAVLIDFIYSYLGTNEVFDKDGKTTINCDKAVEFLDKYFSLYGEYTPESDITAGYKEISANFDSGVAAMLLIILVLMEAMLLHLAEQPVLQRILFQLQTMENI